jgi:hypothetical protein
MGQPLFRQLTDSETMQFAFWITGEATARHFWVNVDSTFWTTTCHQVGACLADYGLWMPPGSARQRIDRAASKK